MQRVLAKKEEPADMRGSQQWEDLESEHVQCVYAELLGLREALHALAQDLSGTQHAALH